MGAKVIIIGTDTGGLCLAQGSAADLSVYERERTPTDRLQGIGCISAPTERAGRIRNHRFAMTVGGKLDGAPKQKPRWEPSTSVGPAKSSLGVGEARAKSTFAQSTV